MQFRKIRLTGFKSFVDPTELLIEPGLTGIVGPNGCGKSNLVEALRWVMGETSARQMRGGEMNDVIFGGTSSRTPRNIAEVSVHLDNSQRRAPVGFNDHLEIEISRNITTATKSTSPAGSNAAKAPPTGLMATMSAPAMSRHCLPMPLRGRARRHWSARAASAR